MMRILRRALLLGFGLLPLAAPRARARTLAAVPLSREDLPWWAERHRAKLAERASRHPQVIWLGDSITQNFERHGPPALDDYASVWNRFYGDRDAFNLGFKGDTTAHILWRVLNGELAGTRPKLVILLAGANNLGRLRWPAPDTLDGIEAIIAALRRTVPGAHIVLIGTLPREGDPWVVTNQREIIAGLAQRYGGGKQPDITFFDPSPLFETRDGTIRRDLYWDPQQTPPELALHPSPQGMTELLSAIEPSVARILGDRLHG
jgi:lysophospholipase L1-like esterase